MKDVGLIYEDAEKLFEMLRRDGCSEVADDIEDGMLSGATGGEILMRLRADLRCLRDRNVPMSQEAQSILDKLLSEIRW